MGPTGPTALVSKASISQCRFLPMRDLVEIEVVGAQRRFGAEMCVASAGMRAPATRSGGAEVRGEDASSAVRVAYSLLGRLYRVR